MNGVPVAPHGLILGEDGATASRKLSKPLLPQFPPAWDSKIPQNIEIEELGGGNHGKIPPTLPMEPRWAALWNHKHAHEEARVHCTRSSSSSSRLEAPHPSCGQCPAVAATAHSMPILSQARTTRKAKGLIFSRRDPQLGHCPCKRCRHPGNILWSFANRQTLAHVANQLGSTWTLSMQSVYR